MRSPAPSGLRSALRGDRAEGEAGYLSAESALERLALRAAVDRAPDDDPVDPVLNDVDDMCRAILGGAGDARFAGLRLQLLIADGRMLSALRGHADGGCSHSGDTAGE